MSEAKVCGTQTFAGPTGGAVEKVLHLFSAGLNIGSIYQSFSDKSVIQPNGDYYWYHTKPNTDDYHYDSLIIHRPDKNASHNKVYDTTPIIFAR